MKHILFFLIAVQFACSTTSRKPSSTGVIPQTAPTDSLSLEQALKQGKDQTVGYLKAKVTAESFTEIPEELQIEKTAKVIDEDRRLRSSFIRKFDSWSYQKKMTRAQSLISEFECSKFHEAQGMAVSFEKDFPNEEAFKTAEALHSKVLDCDNPQKEDSYLRLTVFAIFKGDCSKALEVLGKLPPVSQRGNTDRITYLKNQCSPQPVAETRNPWGGYGAHLGEFKFVESKNAIWFLSATSGEEVWDQLLATLIELNEKGEFAKIRHMVSRLNYEKFRTLPYPFQASVLAMMHFSGMDLAVFQAMHKYLSDNPQLITKEVLGLLFPIRFWESIVKYSNGIDPVLVKALIRQESAFDPRARSHAKAFGLTQVIYPTARIFGMKSRKQLFEPEANIRVGAEFLKRLVDKFGSVELALAAYNAGPDRVREWQKRYPTDNLNVFVEMIPYTETREYVRLVLRNYKIYKTVLTEPTDTAELASNP